ncbi:MAG TPA: MIP/aquaporin family protein [Dehalococcoidia bacterium]|nr:MIP/aquaporin family protein [Dehalococcoidia bacterium]
MAAEASGVRSQLHASNLVPEATLAEWIRPLVAEFFGPFALVFVGAGSVLTTGAFGLEGPGQIVAVALAHGLAFGLMIAAAGHLSVGFFNPAISIGLWVAGKLGTVKTAAYIVAQLAGAVVAALLLRYIFQGELSDQLHLGAPAIAKAGEAAFIVGRARGFVTEVVLTFLLMYVIYGSALDRRGPSVIAPLVIGLAVTMDILMGGPLTGAAMNPARAFGPALVANFWADHWIYWIAPLIGASLAAALFAYVMTPKEET